MTCHLCPKSFFSTIFGDFSSLFFHPSSFILETILHRISIARREKERGGSSSSFKLNLTDPCSTWGMPGALGQLFQYKRKYNAESLKQGSRRFISIVKTKYIANLGIVYLCYFVCGRFPHCFGLKVLLVTRAGHATILSRQCDHVIRPQSCL